MKQSKRTFDTVKSNGTLELVGNFAIAPLLEEEEKREVEVRPVADVGALVRAQEATVVGQRVVVQEQTARRT